MNIEREFDDVFSVISPHIFEDRGAFRSLNRLLRRQFRRVNIQRHGRLRYLMMRASLPYLLADNTSTKSVKFDMDYVLSIVTQPVADDRKPPYRYDTPVVVVRYAGRDYMIDGGKRMRYLHYKLKRKEIDALHITVDDSQNMLSSLFLHVADRIGQNFPRWLKG